jgi:hypothetical protein
MARTKNEVLTIRTTAEVKALLKLVAEREGRSIASMIEVLDHCERNEIWVHEQSRSRKRTAGHD